MNASTLLGQAIIVLTGIIMAVAAAFFLLDQFIYPHKMPDIAPAAPSVTVVPDTTITGIISKVTTDEMVPQQKALVTIQTTTGETKDVVLPADSNAECVAKVAVSVEQLTIGATVLVSGEETSNGTIEPCKNASDDFTIKG